MRALLVFHGLGCHPLSFLLKKGFNHVFVCVDDGTYWIKIDRLARGLEVEVVAASDYDMSRFYRAQDFTVVETEYDKDKSYPFEVANCVGLTKTICGFRSLCFTPHQLYKRLT